MWRSLTSSLTSLVSISLLLITHALFTLGCQYDPKIELHVPHITSSTHQEDHRPAQPSAQSSAQPSTQSSTQPPTQEDSTTSRRELDQEHRRDDLIISSSSLTQTAEYLKRALPPARRFVTQQLQMPIPPLRVYLSKNAQQMKRQAVQRRGGYPPEWAGGLAYPKAKEIYLHRAPFKELNRTLIHELVHISLGQGTRFPLWINEGTAVALSEGISFERIWYLNEAVMMNQLLSFHNLTQRFPHFGVKAQVAYAQSAHFIYELSARYGDSALQGFLQALTQGVSLSDASQLHFKERFTSIEAQWRSDLQQGSFAWVILLFQESTVWVITILIFLLGGTWTLRKRRLEYERLLALEELQGLPQVEIRDVTYSSSSHDSFSNYDPSRFSRPSSKASTPAPFYASSFDQLNPHESWSRDSKKLNNTEVTSSDHEESDEQ